jgi:hypothetical protein
VLLDIVPSSRLEKITTRVIPTPTPLDLGLTSLSSPAPPSLD